jgi:hypothetical protein
MPGLCHSIPPTGDFELVKIPPARYGHLKNLTDSCSAVMQRASFLVDGYVARRISDKEGVWKYLMLKDHPDHLLAGYYEGLMLFRKVNNDWRVSKKDRGI